MSDQVMAFVSTADAERALSFYRDILGLNLTETSPFASVYDVEGTMLRVTTAEPFEPQQFTVLGFRTQDIAERIRELTALGVGFTIYEGMGQVDFVWTTPGGDYVAWFTDPDGNVLSLTQFA